MINNMVTAAVSPVVRELSAFFVTDVVTAATSADVVVSCFVTVSDAGVCSCFVCSFVSGPDSGTVVTSSFPSELFVTVIYPFCAAISTSFPAAFTAWLTVTLTG